MKKSFFAFAFVAALLFAQNVFASSSPSLDGRAVVAKSGTFPKGYFAKTVGYLPGDSISVTNPVNGRQVSILVIGSLDASEGVAILLSPEAAEALSIKRDSNNLVKLTKRNGTADTVANGSAVITNVLQEEVEELEDEIAETENAFEEMAEVLAEETEEIPSGEFDVDEEIPEDTENAVSETEGVFEDIPEETENAVAEAEKDLEEIPEETEEDIAEKSEKELANVEEIPEEAEEESDGIAYERVEDWYIPEDSFDENSEAEEVFDEIPEETEEESDEIVYERVEDYCIPEDSDRFAESDEIPEEKVEMADEIPEDAEKESDEIVYERVEDYCIPEDSDENLEEIPEEKAELAESENAYEDGNPYLESEISETETAAEDEYEAIVLVPAEENPPEPESGEKEFDKDSVAKAEVSPKSDAKSEPPSSTKGSAAYLKSESDLESQKYYVQIAVYTKNENVEQLDALYGRRYPLTILDEGARKTVLVGPLGMDEYGSVLERFKLFGFSDAFVRQAN